MELTWIDHTERESIHPLRVAPSRVTTGPVDAGGTGRRPKRSASSAASAYVPPKPFAQRQQYDRCVGATKYRRRATSIMSRQTRSCSALPSFSGVGSAPNPSPDTNSNLNGNLPASRPVIHPTPPTAALRSASASAPKPASVLLVGSGAGGGAGGASAGRKGETKRKAQQRRADSESTGTMQDNLGPLLEEVDMLFDTTREIVAALNADSRVIQEEQVTYVVL